MMNTPPRETFMYRRWEYMDVITTGVTASSELLEVPTGYHEKIERISTWGNSANNPIFEVFVTSKGTINTPGFTPDRTRRVDRSFNANDDIADETQPIYVNNGFVIMGYWYRCNNGDHFQVGFQISIWEKWPFLGHRENRYTVKSESEGAEWKIDKGAWVFKQDPQIENPYSDEKQDDIDHAPLRPWTNGKGSIILRR